MLPTTGTADAGDQNVLTVPDPNRPELEDPILDVPLVLVVNTFAVATVAVAVPGPLKPN